MKSDPIQTQIDQIRARHAGEEMVLLESQLAGHPSSGYSFAAVKPVNTIRTAGDHIDWVIEGKKKSFKGNPWEAFREFRELTHGWLFGYLGYELKNYTEDLQSENLPLTNLPDLWFFEPEFLYRVSAKGVELWSGEGMFEPLNHHSHHQTRQEGEAGGGEGMFEPMIHHEQLAGVKTDAVTENRTGMHAGNQSGGSLQGTKPVPLIGQREYERTVQDIQRRIREGDFYELNYSYPLKGGYDGEPYDLYRKMRQINPVPFGSYLKMGDFAACCASPERFLKKSGTRVVSEPIKGTAGRSADPQMDQKRKNELLNEKNRAENLMIVDLVRHDLAKIAISGSVRVSKLYDIQTFGTVHQLISTVEADVDGQKNPVDIIRSCFPMGSMTGAPKIEVMKVIDELEGYRRGLYSGAIGYLDPQGDFDLNVVIRTAIIQNHTIIYPVGGAITGDSDPRQEWVETEIKSRSVTQVFE